MPGVEDEPVDMQGAITLFQGIDRFTGKGRKDYCRHVMEEVGWCKERVLDFKIQAFGMDKYPLGCLKKLSNECDITFVSFDFSIGKSSLCEIGEYIGRQSFSVEGAIPPTLSGRGINIILFVD